jgi:hypothetical protein
MKKIILSLSLLFGIATQGQTFEWLKVPEIPAGINLQNTAYISASDPEGNIYLTGFKDSPVLLNDIMGNLYYTKYSSGGDVIFSKTFTGKCAAYNMVSDAQGNIILALAYTENMTIDDTDFSVLGDEIKHVLVKMDSNGNLIWFKELHIDAFDLGYVQDFRAIAIDAEDNIYAGYDNYMYSYITKYSPLGIELLTIEQQNANRLTSTAVDTEGNIYAAGACASINAMYGGTEAPTDLQYNTYLVKYSPQGNFQWIKYVEDITCPEPHVVVSTPDEIYFSSYLFTSNNFDNIEIEGPSGGFEDIFIAKLNSEGIYQWVKEALGSGKVNPGSRNFLNLDSEGNLYFAGNTAGTVNWGNDITTSTNSFSSDALIVKYNSDGDVLFAKIGGGDSEDRMDGITIGSEGNIFVTGVGYGNGTFDNIEHEGEEFTSYPFFSKITMEILGFNDHEAKEITVYPNPASSGIILNGLENDKSIEIVNSMGQTVKNLAGITSEIIDISDLSSGIYYIKSDKFKSKKFIKK